MIRVTVSNGTRYSGDGRTVDSSKTSICCPNSSFHCPASSYFFVISASVLPFDRNVCLSLPIRREYTACPSRTVPKKMVLQCFRFPTNVRNISSVAHA